MDEVKHGERHREHAEEDVRQGHVGYQDVPCGFEKLKLVQAECVRQRNEVAIKIIALYNRAPRLITALLMPYNRAPRAM